MYLYSILPLMAFLVAQLVKKSACNAGDPDSIPWLEDLLEKG